MPLPTPNSGESHDDFVDRCMANETANEDFPDAAQRRAVCESQWERGTENRASARDWYRIRAAADDDTAEIEIFDDIGGGFFSEGVTLKSFKKDWDKIKDRGAIRLLLNSYGGSVFEGLSIYNLIQEQRDRVTVEVMGIAASIASVVALAGARVIMREGAMYMIHQPFGAVIGNASDMRKVAATLDKVSGEIVSIYETQAKLSRNQLLEAMDAETWYTADEAVAVGFADELIETKPKKTEPSAEALKLLHHIPQALLRPEETATVKIDTAAIATTARDVGRINERLAQLRRGA